MIDTASTAATAAAGATAAAVTNAVDTATEIKETTFQKKASDFVRNDGRIKTNINTHLASKVSQQKASLEDYLKFVNIDLASKPLDVFVKPHNIEHSIFSPKSSLDPSIVIPNNFDAQIFKDILRTYLT